MERKPDTPVRKSRRKYEERNKDERKGRNKVRGTSIEGKNAGEIGEVLAGDELTKVALIVAGYEALRELYEPRGPEQK